MAITYITGFEMSHLGEFWGSAGTFSVTATAKRSGAYGIRVNPTDTNGYVEVRSVVAGATLRSFARSFSFWVYFVALPTGNTSSGCQLGWTGAGANVSTSYRVSVTGSTYSTPSVLVATSDSGGNQFGTTTLQTGVWYHIGVECGYNAGVGTKVYLNKMLEATATGGTGTTATTSFCIGTGTTSTCDYYIDDVVVDDATVTGGPSAGSQLLLLPTADPGALNSWTNGGGGTTSIFEGVNNIPPVGVAASTNGVKIKNAASGSNLDYIATMQTYIAAGIPVGSKINAIMAICNDGEEVATGTKAGGVWVASNPAQAAPGNTFDYGDDAGALGTFPTGWKTHYGPVTGNPSVIITTAPTMTVRKTGSTTRVVDVDFMGIYVDYTPPQVMGVIHQPTPAHFNTYLSY